VDEPIRTGHPRHCGAVAAVPRALTTPAFLEIAERQDRVLSRAQLATLGLRRDAVLRRVGNDTWQQLGKHVVVLHSGPLSRRQQQWAAVLHAGPGAALAGLSALEAEGLRGLTRDQVDALTRHGIGRRRLDDDRVVVVVHESRSYAPELVLPGSAPPRLTRVRAAVDEAAYGGSARWGRTVLAACVQQRLVTAEDLATELTARPWLPRQIELLVTVSDVGGGSESLPELEFLRGLREHGMPIPDRQTRVSRPGGYYVLDADYDAWAVTVEINGVQHVTLAQREADDVRRSRLAIGGRLVVDVGSWTVRHDIVLAVLLTADALLSRGWQPGDSLREHLDELACRHPSFEWQSTWRTSVAVSGTHVRHPGAVDTGGGRPSR
jgi:hypothetical protein